MKKPSVRQMLISAALGVVALGGYAAYNRIETRQENSRRPEDQRKPQTPVVQAPVVKPPVPQVEEERPVGRFTAERVAEIFDAARQRGRCVPHTALASPDASWPSAIRLAVNEGRQLSLTVRPVLESIEQSQHNEHTCIVRGMPDTYLGLAAEGKGLLVQPDAAADTYFHEWLHYHQKNHVLQNFIDQGYFGHRDVTFIDLYIEAVAVGHMLMAAKEAQVKGLPVLQGMLDGQPPHPMAATFEAGYQSGLQSYTGTDSNERLLAGLQAGGQTVVRALLLNSFPLWTGMYRDQAVRNADASERNRRSHALDPSVYLSNRNMVTTEIGRISGQLSIALPELSGESSEGYIRHYMEKMGFSAPAPRMASAQP